MNRRTNCLAASHPPSRKIAATSDSNTSASMFDGISP